MTPVAAAGLAPRDLAPVNAWMLVRVLRRQLALGFSKAPRYFPPMQ